MHMSTVTGEDYRDLYYHIKSSSSFCVSKYRCIHYMHVYAYVHSPMHMYVHRVVHVRTRQKCTIYEI